MPSASADSNSCQSCPVRKLPTFSYLSDEEWQEFQRLRTTNNYRRGSAIFYEGNRPLGLYFICRGRVKLVKDDLRGRGQIVRIVEAPDFLGDRAFFAEQLYACTSEVMEDARICFLEKRHVWTLFSHQPSALLLLVKRFASELGRAEEYMHCLAVCTIRARLATHLLRAWRRLADSSQGGNEFTLGESRSELAEVLGTTPEAVSRALNEFCSKGWMEIEGRHVRILDSARLRQAACLSESPTSWRADTP